MATTIRILPENLCNKIAAGEVVERPASVVKELVENALDAGASEIVVEIEAGGRRLIKVSDNGCGMSRDDALLSLERHATSKIVTDEDLFAISTLGFRGEALPSIASVSRLTITTRTGDSLEGAEIYAEGGRIRDVKSCGMAVGTTISVRNLFFNTPARLKFMKSSETESGHIGELLSRLAISRPEVRFTYLNDGKTVIRALNGNLRERAAAILGRSVASALYPVNLISDPGITVTGFVAGPDNSKSAASHLYTYINGRYIRDKVVQHAILQAYRNFQERGRYPVVAIFINIPPAEVDVNVHPTKHEVRFREQGRVHDAIQAAVESVLRTTPWLADRKAAAIPPTGVAAPTRPAPLPLLSSPGQNVAPAASVQLDLSLAPPQPSPNAAPVAQPSTTCIASTATASDRPEAAASQHRAAADSPCHEKTPKPDAGSDERTPRTDACVFYSTLNLIGQFNAAYILCQSGSDLVLIDQHAAHERVAFERLKKEFNTREVACQGLLFPETIELSHHESATTAEHLDELSRLGFMLEEFGGTTWLLKAVPQIMAATDYRRHLHDIIEEFGSLGRSRTFMDIHEDILAKIACHSVVRGHQSLSETEIKSLFRQMDQTDFSSNCPHGRPVMQTLTLSDIERMFKRA